MAEKNKKGLLVFFFIILLLPYLQHRFEFIGSGGLGGYFTDRADTVFTVRGWFSGSYQEHVNDYYNDHIGFRPDLVRLNAQIDYSFFRKLDYGGTTLGYNNYLYYDNYLDAYYGRDYAGDASLREKMVKLKRIQDTLAKLGKSLILVYAPCKAWYYSEHIPDHSKEPSGPGNNYKTNARIGDSLGINQVDFNSWFLALKKSTKELLYSRQGIHWTNYGAILAADSLIRYIEKKRNIRMPHPTWTEVEHTMEPVVPDDDMADILNLIFKVKLDTFCYPKVYYQPDMGVTKPKCIYIGDSYVINLLRMGIPQHVNAEWQFWFYFRFILNETNYDKDYSNSKLVVEDVSNEITKTDCVILVYTPMNGAVLGNGFIEEMYGRYFPG